MVSQEILNRLIKSRTPKEKKAPTPIAKKSEKKKKQEADDHKAGTNTALDQWFAERREEMSGKCDLCKGKTEKRNDATYRFSIHHLFDKRDTMFPSVSTNEHNWLELCHFGNSCHSNIHNKTITWELLRDSAEWSMIVEKAKKVYPFIAEGERKNIPDILLKEILAAS